MKILTRTAAAVLAAVTAAAVWRYRQRQLLPFRHQQYQLHCR